MPLVEELARTLQPALNVPYVRRTRRNHGLEHATVHVLSSRIASLSAAGRSDADGFWLMGDLPTEQVESAAHEALRRMKAGEARLAIHPNCGTSLLTTGTMVGLAALIGSIGVKKGAFQYLSRLPSVIVLSIFAILFSRPLGLQLQEHITTSGDLGDLEIVKIERSDGRGVMGGKMVLHRVTTKSS